VRRMLALLVVGLLAASLAAPAAAVAKPGSAVRVVPPANSPDDTAAIQAALDWCVTQGPGCTVQLQAGTYRISQLVTYNFRGTFRGAGKDRTIVEALPNLHVDTAEATCKPNLTDCRWPSLIIFVDGDIQVTDLAVQVPATYGSATLPYLFHDRMRTHLFDALRFMGTERTDVAIDRVAVEGAADGAATSIYGFNLVNGILYAGELPRSATPLDLHVLTGSFVVRNSSFASMLDGVGQGGFVSSSRVTIGGSPSAGNRFEDVLAGIDLETAEGSTFDVSYNVSSAAWDSMWVVPWAPEFVPTSPSQYLIHDNTFLTSSDAAEWAQGILLWDDPANPWIHAKIWHNKIQLRAPLGEGIDATYTTDTEIRGNTITGAGEYAAIALWGATRGAVIANDVSGLTTDPDVGFAQIYLDPESADSHVVCGGPGVTVLDEGTGNKVTGCGSLNFKGGGHHGVAPACSSRGCTPSLNDARTQRAARALRAARIDRP
jgi:hypothetical protein